MDELKIYKLLTLGFMLLSIGATLNLFVIKYNNNKMPIKISDFVFNTQCYKSFQDKSEVNFWWLGDIINLGFAVVSIGDIIAFVGILIIFAVSLNVITSWVKSNISLVFNLFSENEPNDSNNQSNT